MAQSAQGKADVTYGLVTAMAATGLFVHTYADRYNNDFLFGDVSTVFVPRILLAMITLLSLGLVVKGVIDRDGGRFAEIAVGRVCAVFGACTLSILAVWFIGYLIAMPPSVFLVGLAIGYPKKLILAAVSLVAPLLTYGLLGQFAQVSFPAGQIY